METAVSNKIAFTKMEPADIILFWRLVWFLLMDSGLYSTGWHAVRLMYDMLSGKAVGWLMYDDDENTRTPAGIVVTQMYYMPYSERKALSLIHGSTNKARHVDDDEWRQVYKALIRYGKKERCTHFEVYSNVGRVRDILLSFGFEPSGLYTKEL